MNNRYLGIMHDKTKVVEILEEQLNNAKRLMDSFAV